MSLLLLAPGKYLSASHLQVSQLCLCLELLQFISLRGVAEEPRGFTEPCQSPRALLQGAGLTARRWSRAAGVVCVISGTQRQKLPEEKKLRREFAKSHGHVIKFRRRNGSCSITLEKVSSAVTGSEGFGQLRLSV